MECNRPQDIDMIITEIARAREMGYIAAKHFREVENKDYYTTFLPSTLTEDETFADKMEGIFRNLENIASPFQSDYEVRVTCENDSFCTDTVYAYMSAERQMNLCDIWFDNRRVRPTDDVIKYCTLKPLGFKSLKHFRMTKSFMILHEWTHTTYGMGGTNADTCKALDFAYGVDDCISLAKDTFIRDESRYRMSKLGPMCPDDDDPNKEGVCPKELAQYNADSLALISIGIYYSKKCKVHIPIQPPSIPPPPPIPPPPSLESRFVKRVPEDVLIIDEPFVDDLIIDIPQYDCEHDGIGDLTGLGSGHGRCALHVVQYQKENPDDPASYYRFDVFIFSHGIKIGELIGADAPPNKPVSVESKLPKDVLVTAQTKDEDPVLFAFKDQMWTSGDEGPGFQCSFGGYDGGDREGDCSFNC